MAEAASGADGWSLSIVSHGHAASVTRLIEDCARLLDPQRFELIVTQNDGADAPLKRGSWRGGFRLIRNPSPRGFAANHNRALALARRARVAVVDPDLRLHADPFASLEAQLVDSGARIVAVQVSDACGRIQDNARHLLTPTSLLRRYLLGVRDAFAVAEAPRRVDWVAGLFMAMRRDTFKGLGGFDERYHLYCEDTELCLRCWNSGGEVWLTPFEGVVHDARRRTLKSIAHFGWHCASLATLWRSPAYRRYRSAPPAGLAG
jgi:GT2 family glycosyltransferase